MKKPKEKITVLRKQLEEAHGAVNSLKYRIVDFESKLKDKAEIERDRDAYCARCVALDDEVRWLRDTIQGLTKTRHEHAQIPDMPFSQHLHQYGRP